MRILLPCLTALIVILSCTGCEEYVEVDVKPQLEITVYDISENIISGVSVRLFASEENFLLNKDPVDTETTDNVGKVLFKELDETVYYFYAEKGGLNNFYEVVTFTTPLKKNEILKLSCVIR